MRESVGPMDPLISNALPIGLAHGIRLKSDVAAGQPVTEADVVLDESQPIVALRRELLEL